MNNQKSSLSLLDKLITELDHGLKTIFVKPKSSSVHPDQNAPDLELSPSEMKNSSGLMRVNHTGEICAQALYRGQAFIAESSETQNYLLTASIEENDHLAWCQKRLDELGSRPSFLNIFWYANSWLIGFTAAKISDAISLGFVVETENQVMAHLSNHLSRLSPDDLKSQAILKKMKEDEAHHAQNALQRGAAPLPKLIQKIMKAQSKIMTTTAFYI